jgi:hypothetical protein
LDCGGWTMICSMWCVMSTAEVMGSAWF